MNPPTYAELVEALRKLSSILWMAEKYAEAGGIFGPENADYADATHGLDALLARAESAKLVGTYVWHDVREELPEKTGSYLCAYEECDVAGKRHKSVGTLFFASKEKEWHHHYSVWNPTHWTADCLHPSALKGAE